MHGCLEIWNLAGLLLVFNSVSHEWPQNNFLPSDKDQGDYDAVKACTHEGTCSRSTLLQHAPGAKLPRLHQRLLVKKYVAQQNFCFGVLLPHIKLVWHERASSRGKSVARVCFRSKLGCTKICLRWHGVSPVGQSNWLIFFIRNSLRTQSGCFVIQLPRRVFRGYWLGYLPGSVFQEQAPPCVPALMNLSEHQDRIGMVDKQHKPVTKAPYHK